ncbi:MAG: 3D domain-containing protein [Acutalibacteraceae bacterium]|nr:3D domain-containing protein [Acutalibacteraceae bacterium]
MLKKSKRYARKVMDYAREHTRRIGLIGMSVLIAAVTTLFCLSVNVVSISDGTNTHTLYTLKSDVRGILGYAGYLGNYNVVNTDRDGNKLSIEVVETFPVYITYGDKTITHITAPSTVDDILLNAGVEIKDDDILSVDLNELIDKETYIDIVPAPEEKEEVKTSYNNHNSITASAPVATTVSANGAISTLVPDIDIVLDENGIPVNYTGVSRVQATAYTYTGYRCATGVNPQPGYIAVNPKIIPYGTKMYIVSADGKYVYGYAIAADTGGYVKSRPTNVDLFMETNAACKMFGRRDVIIYFLE